MRVGGVHLLLLLVFAGLAVAKVTAVRSMFPDSRTCRQNQGRVCSAAERDGGRLLGLLARNTTFDINQTELNTRNKFVFTTKSRVSTNPGLMVYNSKLWGVARLTLRNGTTGVGWTSCPRHSMYRSRPCPSTLKPDVIFMITYFQIDPRGHLTGEVRSVDFDFLDKSPVNTHTTHYGPEDPRVFSWGDDIYLAYNALPLLDSEPGHVVRRMRIQRLFPDIGASVQLSGKAFTQTIEKNWSPIGPKPTTPRDKTPADMYLFSRFLDPHEIVQCSRMGQCSPLVSTNHTAFFARFKRTHMLDTIHLGTNAVRVSEKLFGAIFHGLRLSSNGQREYLNLPYLFESAHPYAVKYVAAKPLSLPISRQKSKFVYTSGLSFVDGDLVVAYNVDDATSSYYIGSVDSIFGDVIAVIE